MPDHISANKRRAASVVSTFVAVTVALGAVIGLLAGSVVFGLIASAALAAVMVLFTYSRADDVVLRVSRAVPASAEEHKRLFNVVDGLCIASGLPRPRVYVIADPAMNALATGLNPRSASIAVTTGLLESMNRVELEAVIGHQLARIRNHDTLAPTLAVTLIGALPLVAELLLRAKWWNGGREARAGDRPVRSNPVAYMGLALLGCSAGFARLLRATSSPGRESLDDQAACQMTRYPPGLVSALGRLAGAPTVTHSATGATAQLWMAEPLSGVGDNGQFGWFHHLVSTHPPIEDRIALLREL